MEVWVGLNNVYSFTQTSKKSGTWEPSSRTFYMKFLTVQTFKNIFVKNSILIVWKFGLDQDKFQYIHVWKTLILILITLNCHIRFHLGFSAKLKIWQEPACKMELQSDTILMKPHTHHPPTHPPSRRPSIPYRRSARFLHSKQQKTYQGTLWTQVLTPMGSKTSLGPFMDPIGSLKWTL